MVSGTFFWFCKEYALKTLRTGILASILAASPVLAGEQSSSLEGKWTVTTRLNLGATPSFEGSKTYSPVIAPGLSVKKAGTIDAFSTPDDSISLALYDTDWLRAGPAARIIPGRSASDDHVLNGFKKINLGAEAGGFIELWPKEWLRLRAELRHGVMGHYGFDGDLMADGVYRTGAWTLSGGPRLALADRHYMGTYFSVSDEAAAANGRVATYRAQGGIKSFGLGAAARYDWTTRLSTTAYARWMHLAGSAGNSPITRMLGSKEQLSFGVIAAWSFDVGPF